MDFPEFFDPALEWIAPAGPGLVSAFATARAWLAEASGWLLSVEMPVPDAALVGAFALAVAATILSQRGRSQAVRGEVEDLYRAELLTANRRAQQARGELTHAKQAIERERQKRRREAGGSQHRARHKTAPVPTIVSDNRIAASA